MQCDFRVIESIELSTRPVDFPLAPHETYNAESKRAFSAKKYAAGDLPIYRRIPSNLSQVPHGRPQR
ncbi:hypothetical protein PLANPX_2108 [Lacipirellula parvula]|uniref:Uncharacterized protein n=1 Tax=Lacipirellula parvula TaxID=2650471 RepID=A0A5K7XDT1_9BACT|nr:hypothetical protein PLANPX_2108 [Lacipirellula parvula]